MISLVPSMLRARPAQAVAVLLLSAVATAAAVAGPVAVDTLDAAVVHSELARATPSDVSVSISASADPGAAAGAERLESEANLMMLPGFTRVAGGQFSTYPLRPPGTAPLARRDLPLVFRADLCAHVVVTSGRCLAGTYEVMVTDDVARDEGLRPGEAVVAQALKYDRDAQPVPDGPPTSVTVVGVYRPNDPDEPYWGAHGYFPATASGGRTGPVFVDPVTFDLIGHQNAMTLLDVIAPPDAFGADRREKVRAQVTSVLDASVDDTGGGPMLATSIPDLIDRIDAGQSRARELVSVAFVALVALCWYVVFLTVGYGVAGRRAEIGLVSLRGIGRIRRWWLATGETLVAIVAGAPVGYLLGYALVGLVARVRLGGTAGSGPGAYPLGYAALAVGGAVLVALLGQAGTLGTGVLDLLRGVPRRPGAWRSITGELTLVALAALGVLQLRGGGLVGVGVVVPGLVVCAAAVLAARAFTPLAGLVARVTLRRGRLGSGLAAVQIARRPGSQRLFALVAAAVGLLAFVAAAVSVASQARAQRAAVTAGAPTVVTVRAASAGRLLAATHAVDPAGTWAMAVQPVDQNDSGAPPVLAVDSARLATVAHWDDTGLSARAAASALAATPAAPIVLRGTAFTVDASADSADPSAPGTVMFAFVSLADGSVVDISVRVAVGARRDYTATASDCAAGCRLTGLTLQGSDNAATTVNLYGVRTPAGPVVGAAQLGRFYSANGAAVGASDGSLRIMHRPSPFSSDPTLVVVRDAPMPVPALSTGSGPHTLTGLDGEDIDARPAGGRTALLPRLGADGILVDLGYLSDVGLAVPASRDGEVWLGAHAPTGAVARLRAAGLAVTSVRTERDALGDLAATGPAMALQFHLAAAALGLLLGLGGLAVVALVDRRVRAGDLRALRRQGLPPRFVRRAALWGYLSLVLGASAAGLLAAAAAWTLTGPALPVFLRPIAALPTARWPNPGDVLRPWAAATAVLAAGAVVAGWSLRRAVATGGSRPKAANPASALIVPFTGPTLRTGGNAMAGLAVTCRRVVQIYRAEAGDVVALAGVDLTIAPGEMLALVGPSGSGKSTLIALLSGLMRPSAGRINIGTYDVGKLSDAEISRLRGTEIGVVLQGAARNLLPYATLAKNVRLAQARAARTRGIVLDDPERILDLVGLGGLGGSHISDLPPGAQQRAALAVGIATGPGLLLVDEPTSQLDTHGRDEVITAIETVNRERGTTIVVVTHDAEVGARIGRAVTIRDGRVGAEGRGGQDFAVVAGDGTVQLPPEVLGDFPPGTLFTVDRTARTVSFALSGEPVAAPDPDS